MDSGNSNAVRGLANIYREQSPEKATQFIQSLSASQRRSIDDIERSLTNEQLSAQAAQLESQETMRRPQKFSADALRFPRATCGSPTGYHAICIARVSAARRIT